MKPRSSKGAAISASCSFLIATAETTLSFSFCSINSKSVVTSSAENGNAFSIWIRIISGNSAGSIVGKQNRWASTLATGSPRTKSSVAVSNGTASSSVSSLRTSHEPFCSAERKRLQPWAVGIIKTDVAPVSISNLLPADHLRRTTSFLHYHPYGARNVARSSHAHNSKDVRWANQRSKRLKLLRCKTQRIWYIRRPIDELKVIGCSIDSVRASPQLQEAIDHIVAYS